MDEKTQLETVELCNNKIIATMLSAVSKHGAQKGALIFPLKAFTHRYSGLGTMIWSSQPVQKFMFFLFRRLFSVQDNL
jgi:hypothetical protein